MRFAYPRLERMQDARGRRFYLVDGVPHPSVTTVLSETNPKMAEIRRRMDPEIPREAARLGMLVHRRIEEAVAGVAHGTEEDPLEPLAARMASVLIERAVSRVSEVWGSEVALYMPGAYAGTTDMVAVWGGEPVIVDFKTTRAPKRESQIRDYFIQLVAYAAAHDRLFGTDIGTGVVCMVSRDLVYQEFRVRRGPLWDALWDEWRARLGAFAVREGWIDLRGLGDAWRSKVSAVLAATERTGTAASEV